MTENDLQFTGQYFLEGIIDGFSERNAVILTKDGQKLLWPIAQLPTDCEQGAKIRLILSTAKTDQAEREALAKTILNEILKTQTKDKKDA